jgi:hypothetical protein
MMSAPFRQQIDKESGVLGIIKARHRLAAHDNVEGIALLAELGFDPIGARAGAYNTVSHCSAPEK